MVKEYQQCHLKIMLTDLSISYRIKCFLNNYKSKEVNSLSFNKQSEISTILLLRYNICLSIFIYLLI